MKYYSGSSLFKYSWDQVSSAFWSRYPNPFSTHVISEDAIARQITDNKLVSTRFLTKTNKIPKWGERFVSGPNYVCVIEESVVDPKTKTLTTYTRNIGMTRIMTVEEKCTYKPSPDNPNWTICDRQAWVTSSIFGFSYALQAFGIERFKKNANKAFKGYNHVLSAMFPAPPDNVISTAPKINKEMIKAKAKEATENVKKKAASVVGTQ